MWKAHRVVLGSQCHLSLPLTGGPHALLKGMSQDSAPVTKAMRLLMPVLRWEKEACSCEFHTRVSSEDSSGHLVISVTVLAVTCQQERSYT